MSFSLRSRLGAGLLAAAALSLAAPAGAQIVYYTAGHGDIGVEYHDGHFHAHWHLDPGAVVNGVTLSSGQEYEPYELVAWTTATFGAPTGSAAWLGVAEGTEVFRMGSGTYPPNLGWSLEEAGLETDWVGGSINISLTGWNIANPGEFALVNHGTVLFSTLGDSVTANNNTWTLGVDGHAHAAFYFSEQGYYELTFTWTGEHVTDGLITGEGTFGFQAGAIPEPSAAGALAGLVALGMVALRRKRRA